MDRETRELATNPRLVERVARIARAMGPEPASPAEARRMIGLPSLTPVESEAPVLTPA